MLEVKNLRNLGWPVVNRLHLFPPDTAASGAYQTPIACRLFRLPNQEGAKPMSVNGTTFSVRVQTSPQPSCEVVKNSISGNVMPPSVSGLR